MPTQSDGEGKPFSMHGANLKVGLTPNTISTGRSSSSTALDSTPATISSAYSTVGKENSKMSFDTAKSTKDILAQWRQEREHGRNKLGDRMSTENAKQSAARVNKNGTGGARESTDTRETGANNHKRNGKTARAVVGKATHTDDVIDDRFLDSILRDQFTVDEFSSIDNQLEDGSSIRTTPTSNTALNTMGIDRLSNLTGKSMTSLNVRLFQPIKEDCESQCSQDQIQEDISLITQDTELQSIMLPFDADRMMEEIERDQFARLQSKKGDKSRQSSSSLHSKGIQEALFSLQSSLEKSRTARNEQDIELAKQKEIIDQLTKENASILVSRNDEKSAVLESTTLLFSEFNKIADLCGGGVSIQNLNSTKAGDVASFKGVVNFVKDIVHKSIPSVLDVMSERKLQLHDVDAELEHAKNELSNTKMQISKEKREWQDDEKAAYDHLENTRKDLTSARTKFEKCNDEISKKQSILQQTCNDIEQKEEDLTRRNLQLGEKHLELEDITRLCEERIQLAHTTECNSTSQAGAMMVQQAEIQELHDSTVKWNQSIKAAEKTFLSMKEEDESNRVATEAKLQLRSDLLQEEHDDILEMTAALESRRIEIQAQCERVKEVQNDLLHKEGALAENQKLLDEETSAYLLASDSLKKKEKILCDRELDLSDEKQRFEKEYAERAEKVELREIEVSKNQDDLDQEREQYVDRLRALEQGEEQLKIDCKELSGRVSKFKSTVRAAKSESERKKIEFRELKIEFEERESELVKGSEDLSKDMTAFDELKCRGKNSLEKTKAECIRKQQELTDLKKKCKDTARTLKQMNVEVAKVRVTVEKKMQVAKDELRNIRASYNAQEKALESLGEEKKSVQKEIDISERVRNNVMETIQVKEGLLSKVEDNIKVERTEWECKLAEERTSFANEREASKERANAQYAEVKIKLAKMKWSFELGQKEASDDLESKAEQLELLHNQLLKFQKKLYAEKAAFNKYKKAESTILNLKESSLKKEQMKFIDLENEVQNARKECKSIRVERDDAQLLLNKKEAEIKDIEMEIQNLRKECNITREDRDDTREVLNEKEVEFKKMEIVIQNLREQCSNAMADRDDAQELWKKKEAEFKEIEVESHNLRKERTNARADRDDALAEHKLVRAEQSAIQNENEILIIEIAKKDSRVKDLESDMKELASLRSEKEKLEMKIANQDQTLEKLAPLSDNYESLITERDNLLEALREREAQISKLERDTLDFDMLKVEKNELDRRFAALETEVDTRDQDMQRREQDFEMEREAFVQRIRAVEDSEARMSELEAKEERLNTEYETLSELKTLIDQEKNQSSQKAADVLTVENDINLRQEAFRLEEMNLDGKRKALSQKSKKMKKLESELKAKLSNVAVSEKKLKEYAQLMKKQSKEIKVKEQNLQNVAKILNEKKGESLSKESALISELRQMLDDEQTKCQELSENCENFEARLVARPADQTQGKELEVRIQQMAVRIKEKDEDLTKKQLVLEERLAKCDECEARLACWQQELERFAGVVNPE